jgi:hypothetical protein
VAQPSRTRLVAWALMMPAVLGLCHTVLVEAVRLVRPASPLFTARTAPTFAAALLSGGPEEVYVFLLDQVDANAPVPFRDDTLTDGRFVDAAPLLIAVAARNGSAVVVLLSFGARMDLPQNSRALCLARHLGAAEIAAFIEQYGGPLDPAACPEPPPPGGKPLPYYVQAGPPA